MCTPAKAGALNADANPACCCNGPRLSPGRTEAWIRSFSVVIPAKAGMTTENGRGPLPTPFPPFGTDPAKVTANDRLRAFAPPCGEAMGRWQRAALTEGQRTRPRGPFTTACGGGSPPTGRSAGDTLHPPKRAAPSNRPYLYYPAVPAFVRRFDLAEKAVASRCDRDAPGRAHPARRKVPITARARLTFAEL